MAAKAKPRTRKSSPVAKKAAKATRKSNVRRAAAPARKPAKRPARSKAKSSSTRSSVKFTIAQLGAEARVVGDRAKAALTGAEKNLITLRQRAAQSALDWVMAHEDRLQQFRDWAKGSKAEGALDTLLRELRAVASKPRRASAAKKK